METEIKIRFYYLPDIDTVDLWLDNPEKEVLSESSGENIVLKYDENGEIIGVEIISLEKLTSKDIEKLPKKIREALKKTLEKISMKTGQIT